jgi:hypothetical protein
MHWATIVQWMIRERKGRATLGLARQIFRVSPAMMTTTIAAMSEAACRAPKPVSPTSAYRRSN